MSDITTVIQQARKHLRRPAAETETDPMLRQFARYDVPEGAQLRQLYAEQLQAAAELQRMMELETTLRTEIDRLRWRAAALVPNPLRPDSPLPTLEQARELAELRQLAELYQDRLQLVPAWQDEARRAVELARRNFQALWRSWADMRYIVDGSQEFAPAMRMGEWQAPDAQRRAVALATIAQLER